MQTKTALLSTLLALGACGKTHEPTSAPKIVGGDWVFGGDPLAKSTVALVDPNGMVFCSGTLIDTRLVVTAAHCLVEYTAGELNIGFGPNTATASSSAMTQIRASAYVHHESYDAAAMDAKPVVNAPNDIGLVTLADDAPSGFEPVAMLGPQDAFAVGATVTLAGFGMTNAVQSAGGILRKLETTLTAVSEQTKEVTAGRPARAPAWAIQGDRRTSYKAASWRCLARPRAAAANATAIRSIRTCATSRIGSPGRNKAAAPWPPPRPGGCITERGRSPATPPPLRYEARGSTSWPMNRMLPVALSRITYRNGRSITSCTGRKGTELVRMTTAVAPAASVPDSFRLMNVLCSTFET